MMTQFKRLGLACLMLVPSLALVSCEGSVEKSETRDEIKVSAAFSDDVEQVLERKIRLVKPLLLELEIIEAVRASNQKNQQISLKEILRLDKQWRATKGVDGFVKKFLTNPCARYLIAFQDAHEGFSEIFIADAKGLNVCQTNKTTDYYQADEEWWVKGFNDGKGHTYHGQIEYDESARSEAISLYIPMMDPQTRRAIGVAKAVVDIISIKREL